jgi:D-inositol-3-phosphate glycosyltransferase
VRIAMISEHASPLAALGTVDAGGQNAHVAALAQALAELGHDVRVYTRWDGGGVPARVRADAGYDVIRVPVGPSRTIPKDELLPYMKPFGRWMAGSWRRDGWRPDVMHAHFWMSGLAALTARRERSAPIVQTYHALGTVKRRHQGRADTSPPSRIPLEAVIGRTVNRVIAQCRDERRELRAIGVPDGRIAIVPSGVDVRRFHPYGPSAPAGDRPRILSIGRLVPRKGHADLIDAIRAVPEAELVVVGGGDATAGADPAMTQLARRAEAMGVASRVRLAGPVGADRMPAWYRSADVVACAPWYEPFGLTPLEAMASAVPVAGYAVGGLLDTVDPGVTGDLVAPRDISGLATALRQLIQAPERRAAYGDAGRARACDCYGWPGIAAQVADVYAQAVADALATHRMEVSVA